MSGKSRILVVEDNDFVRMQIVRFLGQADYEIIETTDGTQALQKVADNIDLAIVDIRMQPMDGFEFIRSIRGRGMEIPVILVTGDQNPGLLNEAGKWSVAAVLMKPVQKERLLKTVAKTLENTRRAS